MARFALLGSAGVGGVFSAYKARVTPVPRGLDNGGADRKGQSNGQADSQKSKKVLDCDRGARANPRSRDGLLLRRFARNFLAHGSAHLGALINRKPMISKEQWYEQGYVLEALTPPRLQRESGSYSRVRAVWAIRLTP
jgi:hypothetical protein